MTRFLDLAVMADVLLRPLYEKWQDKSLKIVGFSVRHLFLKITELVMLLPTRTELVLLLPWITDGDRRHIWLRAQREFLAL